MAFNHELSSSWSDGPGRNPSFNTSGNPGISWTDIEKALEPSSGGRPGTGYGKGILARTDEPAPTDTPAAPGLGLTQAGVSPFRSAMSPSGDFFADAPSPVLDPFQSIPGPGPETMTPGTGNTKLISKLLGNLQRRDNQGITPPAPEARGSLPALQLDTSQAKLDIGLAVNPSEVRQPGKLGRAVVRLEPSSSPRAETEPEATTDDSIRPFEDPFGHVARSHAQIKEDFATELCKFDRTTVLPNGKLINQLQKSDGSILTKTTGELGQSSLLVQDRYRRPVIEHETNSDGTWSFSELSYKGTKPFPQEKVTIFSDGTMAKSKFSDMGQIASTLHYT